MSPAMAPRGARRQRGISMLDALIALALLSFGLLGLTRLQARALAQGSESGARQVAAQYADELLSAVIVDNANFACYTLPQRGSCTSAVAATSTQQWLTRLQAALPEGAASAVYDSGNQRITVTLRWRGKESDETRTVEVTTDVR